MISKLDDYPIHQTADPLAVPATSDRNVYDRYWFNGYAEDGEFYFGIALGRYPHLGIQDGAFSIGLPGAGLYYLGARSSRGGPRQPGEMVGRISGSPDSSVELLEGLPREGVVIRMEVVW